VTVPTRYRTSVVSKASTLRSDLRRHDPLEVAAGCAALSLLPENWASAPRLHALCSYVLRQEHSEGRRRVARDRWSRWVRDLPTIAPTGQWDAPEGLWTQPAQFHGGSYLLAAGGEPGVVPGLQAILGAIALGDWPDDGADFQRNALELAQAVLLLGDALCSGAQLTRYAPAGPMSPLAIPAADELGRRSSCCCFDRRELERIIERPATVLGPLIHHLVDAPLPPGTQQLDPFERTPILWRGDRFVIAWPHALPVAATHALITMAIEAGVIRTLSDALASRARPQIATAAERMNWHAVHEFAPSADLPSHSLVFAIDRDKLTHVLVVADSLDDYNTDNPRGSWSPALTPSSLLTRMTAVERMYTYGDGTEANRANDFLHVVLLAGVGRPFTFGLPDLPTPCDSPTLVMTGESFDTISMLGPDQLDLLKFARAGDRFRRSTRVLAFDTIDEYEMWRGHSRSFYLDDDGRPDFVSVDPSYGRAIREEVARTTDVHAVQTPYGVVEQVALLNGERDIPIYVPFLSDPERPRLVAELASGAWWVLGERTFSNSAHRFASVAMVDCIAYWLWQMEPSLPTCPWLNGDMLTIDVVLPDPDQWAPLATPGSDGPVAQAEPSDERTIAVTVLPAMAARMDSPDNAAERELMEAVLHAVSRLDRKEGGAGLTNGDIEAAIDDHAPLGPKKKINVFATGDRPLLREGTLPRVRLRQDADVSDALDEMSAVLLPRLAAPVGPLEREARVPALNAAVAIHFEHLTTTVAELNPTGLVEELVARHEALIHRNALQERTLGSRIACFAETTLVENMIEELPEVNSTAVALRFLIEYVTACPPAGLRPMSIGVFDELIAHAAEIVNRGMISDVLNYELDDFEISVLGSGRLGVSRDGAYHAGQQSYLRARVPVMARQSAASFASHWEQRSDERPDFADAADHAAKAEFGFTMTELGELIAELVNAAQARSEDVAVERRPALVAELTAALQWDTKRVEQAMELFTLTPRSSFLKPPKPYTGNDVYPWQFNRGLSYLRKPLLRRETAAEPEVLWGMRQTWTAGNYLFQLVMSERLRARTLPMKQFMTQRRQTETAAFNEHVAELCRTHGLTTRTGVFKIGSSPLTRTLADGRTEPIGDVDVLAADVAQRRLLVLECKDLEGARTPSELKNEIDYTFAQGRAKKSKLEIHLERIAWISQHLAAVIEWLGGDAAAVGDWIVDGRLITDIEVLAPHVLGSSPIPVMSYNSLSADLEAMSEPSA
jgi:hypothetical protein